MSAIETVMTSTDAETISDDGEQDNSSDNGDSPITDASKDQSSASTPATESTSIPTLPSTINWEEKSRKSTPPLEWKRKGNVYFGKEDWQLALHAYHSGLTALLEQKSSLREELHDGNASDTPSTSATAKVESIAGSSLVGSSIANPLEVALRSNMAFALLKLQQYNRAEEECNHLLSISPLNSKGTILSTICNFFPVVLFGLRYFMSTLISEFIL